MPPTTSRARTGKRAPSAGPNKKPHRNADALGIALIAVALVTVFALLAGNGGLIGDGLANMFRQLVGQAAWAVPVVIGFAGASLIAHSA